MKTFKGSGVALVTPFQTDGSIDIAALKALVTLQIQAAVRKNVNDSWKISRRDSSVDIDAAIATVLAIWYCDSKEEYQPFIITTSMIQSEDGDK